MDRLPRRKKPSHELSGAQIDEIMNGATDWLEGGGEMCGH